MDFFVYLFFWISVLKDVKFIGDEKDREVIFKESCKECLVLRLII